nr:hypothetical protein [Aggregatibacter actinomycetemcomitans]
MAEPFLVIDENMKLQIHLHNDKPVELSTLCQSLDGISKEYSRFIQNATPEQNLEPCDSNIYVTQITKGSIIVELGTYVAVTYTLVEHANAIFEFGERLAQVYGWLQGENEQPDNITVSELRHLSQTLEPVSTDSKATIQIGSININGGVHLHFEADSMKANALQHLLEKKMAEMKEPIVGLQKGCAMQLAVTATDKQIDKAIIEAFSKKAVKVSFETEEIKQTMIMREHPYHKLFIVDVMVHTVDDKIVLYHIKKLIDILDKE